jgi:hypothetical protein
VFEKEFRQESIERGAKVRDTLLCDGGTTLGILFDDLHDTAAIGITGYQSFKAVTGCEQIAQVWGGIQERLIDF